MKTRKFRILVICAVVLALASGCATAPLGPTVSVMPAPGKPFELFQQEEKECQEFAAKNMKAYVDKINGEAVGKAVVGTVIGIGIAALLLGGRGGGFGRRVVGTGAALGAAAGASQGAADSANSSATLQEMFDNAFMQCMYAKGNQVPGTR